MENAWKAIKEKNRELRELIVKHDTSTNPNPSPLHEMTMVIKGVLDAAVNGGPEKYRDAFFNAQYEEVNPEKKPIVQGIDCLYIFILDIIPSFSYSSILFSIYIFVYLIITRFERGVANSIASG